MKEYTAGNIMENLTEEIDKSKSLHCTYLQALLKGCTTGLISIDFMSYTGYVS